MATRSAPMLLVLACIARASGAAEPGWQALEVAPSGEWAFHNRHLPHLRKAVGSRATLLQSENSQIMAEEVAKAGGSAGLVEMIMEGGSLSTKSTQQPWETLCQGKNCAPDGPPGPATFAWSNWPMGNSLMLYWNARALAVAQGRDFVAIEDPPKSNALLNILPRKVPKSDMTPEQMKAVKILHSQEKETCWACPVPHWVQYTPWRMLYGTILEETQAAISGLNVSVHPWALDQNTAAVHIRCDDVIMANHDDYGILPYQFFEDNLPSHVKRVVLVSKPETLAKGSTKCQKYAWDLKEFLEEKRAAQNLKVEMGGVSKDSFGDWVFMSKAQIAFGSPSTFALTAMLGNGNTVFFPKGLLKDEAGNSLPFPMCVAPPGAMLSQVDPKSPHRNFNWVPTHYLGGKKITALPWDGVKEWLRNTKAPSALSLSS